MTRDPVRALCCFQAGQAAVELAEFTQDLRWMHAAIDCFFAAAQHATTTFTETAILDHALEVQEEYERRMTDGDPRVLPHRARQPRD